MNKDIRLATSFKGHRKRKKLERLLGAGATGYLIDLWITVAQSNPEGILYGWDEEDICYSSNWTGETKVFIDSLKQCGFLQIHESGELEVHDWCDHQGYACKAKERSEQAKKAAEVRWKGKHNNGK